MQSACKSAFEFCTKQFESRVSGEVAFIWSYPNMCMYLFDQPKAMELREHAQVSVFESLSSHYYLPVFILIITICHVYSCYTEWRCHRGVHTTGGIPC